MSLQIDNLAIGMIAGHDINQSYESIGPESIRRAVSGRGIKQMTYDKLRIVTSGRGWIPAGLSQLDYSSQHTLRCIFPRRIETVFSTRQATLPAARRSDAEYLPFGYALFPNGDVKPSAVTMAGNIATVESVSGAIAYAVGYFPQVSAYLARPKESLDAASGSYAWELIAEEV